MNSGFVVTIYGDHFLKATEFFETKPDEAKIKELIKNYSGKRALITDGEQIICDDNTIS